MKNLKMLRKEKNLTQLELQMKTGIQQALLSKYENGNRIPTADNLGILADFYRTSVDFIMDRTDERKPYPPITTREE